MVDDSIVPEWANDVLVAKGLGFEVAGLKGLLWDYFEQQFSVMGVEQNLMVAYFECFIDDSLKNGNVTKGIAVLKEYHASQAPRKRRHYRSAEQPRPVKQSQLTEFEKKFAYYLQDT